MRELEAPGEIANRNPTVVGSRRVTTGGFGGREEEGVRFHGGWEWQKGGQNINRRSTLALKTSLATDICAYPDEYFTYGYNAGA